MRCWIEISAEALRHNYRFFRDLSPHCIVAPVLKSNAYGHGLLEVYQALAVERPPWLSVNYLFEVTMLRRAGYQGRILVVGPIRPDAMTEAASLKADIFVGDEPTLAAWLAADQKPLAHVKVDSGMSRQGFLVEHVAAVGQRMLPHRDQVVGVASHFANVEDVTEQDYALKQLAQFKTARTTLESMGFTLLGHIASSASTLIMDQSRGSLARVGISLYGVWPSQATRISYLHQFSEVPHLRPALEWKTEIAAVKDVKAGRFIGYGCSFRANHDMRVAVLPVGYYEGYPRLASGSGSYVLIHGQRCPIVGRICMNMMMVDVTHLGQVAPLDVVTLIGTDGEEHLDAGAVAAWAQTIHYELLTCLNPVIERRLIG